ncbi:hypothetical protein QE152_g26299 [Popillia japonica]|uniref:Uncharacterized protein n=1 Tax=Popillia japonica TaxID=7064 RepID=A0AAW1JYN7_POPJA
MGKWVSRASAGANNMGKWVSRASAGANIPGQQPKWRLKTDRTLNTIVRIRERTKRNASGYSSGSDISDLDLSSPASIDGIVANVNRQLKRWKVGEKRSKCEVDTAGGAEKESASAKWTRPVVRRKKVRAVNRSKRAK